MAAKKSKLTETTEKVGKALARSSFKAESAGKKAKKKVEDIVGKVSRRSQQTATRPKTGQSNSKKSSAKALFKPGSGLSCSEQIGLAAGDIFHYLRDNGQLPADKVVNAMMRRKNSQAICLAAIGWLAREDKISFSEDGEQLSLAKQQ